MGLKDQQGQGPNYVPAYQTSGTPFVTSSAATGVQEGPVRVQFPYVTKTITVQNLDTSNGLRVAFTKSGSWAVGEAVGGSSHDKPQGNWTLEAYQGNNFFTLPGRTAAAGPSQVTLDVRCKEVYLMSNHATADVEFSLYAGLTGISTMQFPVLTASNLFKGVG